MLEEDAIRNLIAKAFEMENQPPIENYLTEGWGLEEPRVIKNFFGRSRDEIEQEQSLGLKYMENFSYMTPMAARYYLPAVLGYMLRKPNDWESWIFVYGYLMPRKSGKLIENLRELTSAQRAAIAEWAAYLHANWMESWEEFDHPWWEAEELAEAYKGDSSE